MIRRSSSLFFTLGTYTWLLEMSPAQHDAPHDAMQLRLVLLSSFDSYPAFPACTTAPAMTVVMEMLEERRCNGDTSLDGFTAVGTTCRTRPWLARQALASPHRRGPLVSLVERRHKPRAPRAREWRLPEPKRGECLEGLGNASAVPTMNVEPPSFRILYASTVRRARCCEINSCEADRRTEGTSIRSLSLALDVSQQQHILHEASKTIAYPTILLHTRFSTSEPSTLKPQIQIPTHNAVPKPPHPPRPRPHCLRSRHPTHYAILQ